MEKEELKLLLGTDEIILDWQIEALKELYKDKIKQEILRHNSTTDNMEDLLHTYLTAKSETKIKNQKK